jgi:hypothetical protein
LPNNANDSFRVSDPNISVGSITCSLFTLNKN